MQKVVLKSGDKKISPPIFSCYVIFIGVIQFFHSYLFVINQKSRGNADKATIKSDIGTVITTKESQIMIKLYFIMEKFLEVEYRQKALLTILRKLECSYSEEEQEEIKNVVSICKWGIEDQQKQLKEGITELDCYIARVAGKNK